MELALCPRCGAGTSWFAGGVRSSYCHDCGWNLDEVFRLHHRHDRASAWAICGFAILMCSPVIHHNPRQGILLLAGLLAFVPLFIFLSGQSKTALRMKSTRQAVGQKPGTDLSSAAPDTTPTRVVTSCEALQSIPRPRIVRLTAIARVCIGVVRLIAAALAIAAMRQTLFPPQRIAKFSDALLPAGLLLLAALLWFLVPISLREERRLDLLVYGEVILARMAPIPPWWRGERVSFEFHDANGRLIRGQSANQGHSPVAGTYVPVFYDPQNPENCAPACALNYDLVLTDGFPLSSDGRS